MSSTGSQGTAAPAIVEGPAAAGYEHNHSRGLRSQLGPRPGPRARGLAQVAASAGSIPGSCPPAAVIVRRTPPTSAAPGPGCELRAAGLARARRRQARGPRGRRAAGGGRRAAVARARQAAAGRGPSHQRWRGAEGRAEQAGWVGSALRVAAAASTPGPSASRVGRSGAERAVAASPPRAFARLPAPRRSCARAGTSRLRGW